MRYTYLIVLMLVLLSSTVFAAKTTTVQTAQTDNVLHIEYPPLSEYNMNKKVDMHFHVHDNESFRIESDDDLSCYIHLYNKQGMHIADELMTWDPVYLEYEFSIEPNTIINKSGDYPYIVWCNSSSSANFIANYITMYDYDKENILPVTDQGISIMVLVLSVASIYLIMGFGLRNYFRIDKYNAGSFICWIFSLLVLIGGVLMLFEYFTLGTFYKMLAYFLWANIMMFIIIFIYFIFLIFYTIAKDMTNQKIRKREEL